MKGALLLVTAAVAGGGCADNDLSLSIQQMEVVSQTMQCVANTTATGGVGRDRGTLDLTLVTSVGYIGIPLVRNDLPARLMSGNVEFNAIQLLGANVTLTTVAGDPAPLPAGQQKFFYPAAGGRIDPGMAAAMFVELIPATAARALAGNIMANG